SASLDGDTGVTLSSWEGGVSPGAFGLRADWEGKTARSLGEVFAERGVYRPGDEVFVKGLVRFQRLGELNNPGEGLPLTVTITTSKGDTLLTREVKTSRFGTFDTKLSVPADAPLG